MYFATQAGYNVSQAGDGVVNVPLVVDAVVSDSAGKWPSGPRNLVLIEMDDFWPLVNASLPDDLDDSVRTALVSQNPEWAVSTVLFNLPPERFEYYRSSQFAANARRIVQWASGIIYMLGANQLAVVAPVLEELYSIRFASSFLTLMLNMIILLLAGISILLIYSLFVISVESRTFELGIFRMIGLTRSGLVQMLLVGECRAHKTPLGQSDWLTGRLGDGALVRARCTPWRLRSQHGCWA